MDDPVVMLTGARGQVGYELRRSLPSIGRVISFTSSDLDLRDERAIRDAVRRVRPDVIINAAAYTAVDMAEEERGVCMAINAEAPRVLAEEAERCGAWIVHFSSDYVFDGSGSAPRDESSPASPLSVYGASKLAGDEGVARAAERYLIFRTSWVYASRGKNFVLTMMRLMRDRDEVRVVDDQRGAPTWARRIASSVARALPCAMERGASASGVYDLTASGETTWCGFARAIAEEIGSRCAVVPITSSEFGAPAARPADSLMSNEKIRRAFGVCAPDWRSDLKLCIEEAAAR